MIPEDEPKVLLSDRESIIAWLCWNDPNGCFTDEDNTGEGRGPMSYGEALVCLISMLEGAH